MHRPTYTHTRTHKHTHARMYARTGTSTRAHTHMLSPLCRPPYVSIYGVSSGKPVYTIVVPQTINDHSSLMISCCVSFPISTLFIIGDAGIQYRVSASTQEYRCHYVRPMTDLPLSFQTRPVQQVYFSGGGRPTKRPPRKVDSANGKRPRGTKR